MRETVLFPGQKVISTNGEVVEITPKMLLAGARVLADIYDDVGDWLTEDRAYRVFEAMTACAPSEHLGPPLTHQVCEGWSYRLVLPILSPQTESQKIRGWEIETARDQAMKVIVRPILMDFL